MKPFSLLLLFASAWLVACAPEPKPTDPEYRPRYEDREKYKSKSDESEFHAPTKHY